MARFQAHFHHSFCENRDCRAPQPHVGSQIQSLIRSRASCRIFRASGLVYGSGSSPFTSRDIGFPKTRQGRSSGDRPSLPNVRPELDGEIVCLDLGRSQFKELMFHRGQPFFYAFDPLWLNSEDFRSFTASPSKGATAETDRPAEVTALVPRPSRTGRPYMRKRASSTSKESWRSGKTAATLLTIRRSSWVKIKNPNYSQIQGREELFERT